MTPMATSSPIIQNHPSKLSWLASNAMAQVKTLVPQMAVSALMGYALNSLIGLKIQENMTSKEMAVYFALLPIINKVTEPIFKRIISEQDCKNAKQVAARKSIQKCLSHMCSPIPAAVGYNLVAKALNFAPLGFEKALFSPLHFIHSQALVTGATQMMNNALKTISDAYDLDSPQDPLASAPASTPETAPLQPLSSSPDKGLRA